jgi:DNA polymerase-1
MSSTSADITKPEASLQLASKQNKEKVLLIDGSNLAFRMFFALERTNLRNREGEPTWAIYGTLKALFDVVEIAQPTRVAIAFDLAGGSFRHESCDNYKANRPDEMPEELQVQWPLIKDAFAKFNIPILEEPGFEADDLIGIVAKEAEKQNQQVILLSGDKDMFQLVSNSVTVASPIRGGGLKFYGPQEVYDEMGVHPHQIIDYKAIAGDSSDNIPGVKGLGAKSAIKLLNDYDSLDGIYENLDEIKPPKTQEKLREQSDSARKSQFLATIIIEETKKDQAQNYLDEAKLNLPEVDSLVEFLKHFQFNSIIKRLPMILKPFNNGKLYKLTTDIEEGVEYDNTSKATEPNADKWEVLDAELKQVNLKPVIVNQLETFNDLLAKLKQVETYAIDLETDGLDTLNLNIVGFAIAFHAPESEFEIASYYIPVGHQDLTYKQLDLETVISGLKNVLEDSSRKMVMQNAKFEQEIFLSHGIAIHQNFFDTMLASYVFNPANKHGLKLQAARILALKMTEITELIGKGKKQITMDQVGVEASAAYAAADAYVTYRLYLHYLKALDKDAADLMNNIDVPLVKVLIEIERSGFNIDTEYLAKLSLELNEDLKNLEQVIYEKTAKTFNIASPKQLSEVLFDELKIDPGKARKNKSGYYSTDAKVLDSILLNDDNSEHHELISAIINYRELAKLLSTYIDNLPKLINKKTGRVHSDFNQVLTATGRLSSSNPNLQNIPIKTELGRKVRKGFIASDSEHVLISADYSQIELRILAHITEDPYLIEAFTKDLDIHSQTAALTMDKDLADIDEDMRRIGKTLNFALIYMQGAFATARQLGISNKEAKTFIENYFAAFKNVKPFMDETLDFARANHYVETIFNRRRYFRNINSRNKIISKEEERQAFNTVIQGAAADIVKLAMIKLQENLATKFAERAELKPEIILQVHDEIILDVHQSVIEEVKDITKDTLENIYQLKVPLKVNLNHGNNWLEAH